MSQSPTPSVVGSDSTKEELKMKQKNRPFGDVCVPKQKSDVRVMFQNVNGLGYTHQSVKTTGVRNLVYQHEVDIMALAETNINWGKMRRPETLLQVVRRWFQSSKRS